MFVDFVMTMSPAVLAAMDALTISEMDEVASGMRSTIHISLV